MEKSKAVQQEKDWEKFLDLFARVKDTDTLKMLFGLFMTMNEREMMIDRYRLVRALLDKDLTQREIADSLGLSISKITAGSKAVQVLQARDKKYLIKKMK